MTAPTFWAEHQILRNGEMAVWLFDKDPNMLKGEQRVEHIVAGLSLKREERKNTDNPLGIPEEAQDGYPKIVLIKGTAYNEGIILGYLGSKAGKAAILKEVHPDIIKKYSDAQISRFKLEPTRSALENGILSGNYVDGTGKKLEVATSAQPSVHAKELADRLIQEFGSPATVTQENGVTKVTFKKADPQWFLGLLAASELKLGATLSATQASNTIEFSDTAATNIDIDKSIQKFKEEKEKSGELQDAFLKGGVGRKERDSIGLAWLADQKGVSFQEGEAKPSLVISSKTPGRFFFDF
jgi:hypothetical protein